MSRMKDLFQKECEEGWLHGWPGPDEIDDIDSDYWTHQQRMADDRDNLTSEIVRTEGPIDPDIPF